MKPRNPMICLTVLLLSVLACRQEPAAGPEVPSDPLYLSIVQNGVSAYSIAYTPVNASNAASLGKALKDLTGADLPRYKVTDKTTECEIVIGNAGRDEAKELLAELGGQEGFVIAVVGEKLVFAGTDDVWTALALKTFESKVLKSTTYVSDRSFTLARVYKNKETYKDPQLIARLLKRGLSFGLRVTHVLDCPGESSMTVGQGAACDGKYFYFVTRTSDESASIVYKFDMQTKAFAGRSATFYAGHCNDMTYDAAGNRLIIAHGQSEGKILTPLDATSLKKLDDINIPVGSGAITYNAAKDGYAISQGGSTFYVTDASFKVLIDKRRTDSTGYTAQGMGSDDFYVYFPMSGKNDNVLVAYDWEGNYAATLTVPLALESESMFYAAGVYYVCFYAGSKKGSALYRVDPVFNYSYSGK